MRVLFNTYQVAFDCPGGGEIQLLKTKQALERLGVEVFLYDQWNPQFSKIDLVHYFSVQGGSINFCSYVKKKKLPLVISPILWLGSEKGSYPLDEIYQLLKICDLILTNSFSEAEVLSKYFGIEIQKFSKTRNAVDNSFRQQVSPDFFFKFYNCKKPFILNVANIEPRKNQLNLIRAVKKLGLDLIILGNVRDENYFNLCAKEFDDKIKFLGYVPHESELLKSAYRACDLFVLPSTLETPGLSALEAGASGAKIVITSHGCTREYFGEFVTYINNPFDIEEMCNAIIREKEQIRDESLKKYIIENFTWDHAAQDTKYAYEKLLKIY